jgi:hypothetical protein
MATKNIVPRANGEGELGTSSKKWSKVNVQQITASSGVSASFFYGDGSGITGVTGEWDGSHSGNAEITGSLTLQATSSWTTGSSFTFTDNFLQYRGNDGSLTASFYSLVQNPFGAPVDFIPKDLELQAGDGYNISLRAGAQTAPYGLGGRVSLVGGTGSTSLNVGPFSTDVTSPFLVVNGNSSFYDDLLFYARPSTFGSHGRYTSFGYDNAYSASRFTAGVAGSGGANQFIWYVSNDTTSEFPAMFMDFSGNLGINTLTPTHKLQVVGDISGSTFYGDGSGLTGVTGEWDGTHNGNAEITGTLTIQSATNLEFVTTGGIDQGGISNNGLGVLTLDGTPAGGTLNIGSAVPTVNINAASDVTISGAVGFTTVDNDLRVTNNITGSGLRGNFLDTLDISANTSNLELNAPSFGIYMNTNDVYVSASMEVSGNIETLDKVVTPRIDVTDIHSAGGIREAALSPGQFLVMNDFVAGKNDTPDTFAVDYTESKVAVGYDLADVAALADQFTVSGSTKFGNLSTDTHKFTGSIYVSGSELEVYRDSAGSGHTARFENVNGSGNTYIETHGTNQGGFKMYRGGTLRATVDTGGNAFTMYSGDPIAANVGFQIASQKAEFKDNTGHSFGGTKAKLNISASSGPLLRADAANATTSFLVDGLTTTFVSGSGDLLTMDDTTAPPTPTSAAHLYAKTGEMFVMDSAGNETQISPHDENGEWEYFSRNTKTGKVVRIRMERMIRKLEELTGETFIEEE